MYCNGPLRPPLCFFGDEAHPHFFEQEEKLLDLYDQQADEYDKATKRPAHTVPSLFLFVGCNFLSIDRKSCPEHLNDIQKLCLVKLLNAKKRVIEAPMVVIHVAQENPQVKLEELLSRPNHLLLQDSSIDKIIGQIITDSGLTEEIDKIEQSLNFPQEFASEQQSAVRNQESSMKRKHDATSPSTKFEEEKESESPRYYDLKEEY